MSNHIAAFAEDDWLDILTYIQEPTSGQNNLESGVDINTPTGRDMPLEGIIK